MASGSTTVHALPYPLSTDAPSVHSDIQALAQALANSLASPVSVSTSQTLADGQLAISTASPITLTLPTAAANVTCGVFARVATGSNPVTVSAPGGALIYGVGLNGVSSLTLGTIGSFVVLQSNGTDWFVVAGQRDTGWVSLTLQSGWAATSGTWAPAARLQGDRVQMRGQVTGTNPGSSIAHLGAPFIPTVINSIGSPPIPVVVFHGGSHTPVGGSIKFVDAATIDLELGAAPNTSDSAKLDSVTYTVT